MMNLTVIIIAAMILFVGIGGAIVKLVEVFENDEKRKEVWSDWAL